MDQDTVTVFTAKTLDEMFKIGGSGYWKASDSSLSQCKYIVGVANTHFRGSKHPIMRHKHAFFVGVISGLTEDPEYPGRQVVLFDEYAEIDIPEGWSGYRNPVLYQKLEDFGLDPDQLEWKPFPKDRVVKKDTTPELTIDEAKRGLSKKLGISESCIEIIIRT